MPAHGRTLSDLAQHCVLFWPRELVEAEAAGSSLPLLLDTQDKFISVLTLADAAPDAWKRLVDVSRDMSGNMFLKHLMVLSDFGAEALAKVTPFNDHFPEGR